MEGVRGLDKAVCVCVCVQGDVVSGEKFSKDVFVCGSGCVCLVCGWDMCVCVCV
jgi:hypothetical protein